MASGSVVVVLTPLVGALTDRVGRRPLILACALLNLVFDYPLFLFAIRGGTFASLLTALICNAVFQALYTGTIPSILAEMCIVRRLRTLVSTWLVDVTGSPFAPAFYIMTGGALSAIAILSMKEYRNTPLE